MVRTVSEQGVKSEVLGVPEVHGLATGEKIFECIEAVMEKNKIL